MTSTHSKQFSKRAPARKALLAATLLLGAAGMAGSAMAQMANDTHVTGSSYIGLTGGPSDFSRVHAGNGLFTNDDRNTAYGVTYGNYFANQNLGVEFGYTNFGQVARGGGTSKAEGINVSLIARAPLTPMFTLLGKVGTTYGHTEVGSNPLSGLRSGSESGFDWSYGIGGELVINPQWSAVLLYDEAFMKFPGGSAERVSTTTIGARLHF